VRARRPAPAGRRARERQAGYGPVVVDASIAVQWFSHEPRSEASARLLVEDLRLLAPDLMPVEAANAWWKKVRRGDMRATDLDQALVNLLGLGIELVPASSLLDRAARLAVEAGQSVYDCLYLALARASHARLCTDDRALRRVALRLDIAVWTPE